MKTEDLQKLQEYIKSHNLGSDTLVSKIMGIDTSTVDAEYAYYKSVEGKYFKRVSGNCITYIHVHKGVEKLIGWDDLSYVNAKHDIYTFKCAETSIDFSYNEELYHFITTTKVGRYDEYTEISEKQFIDESSKFISLYHQCHDVLKEIKNN